jgi:putative membrane protein
MTHALARTLFAVVALSLGLTVSAADKKSRDDGLSRGDRDFVEKALKDGMTEVELGKIAQQKGASDDVKKFGQQMVDDHTKSGDELKGIASKVGFAPKKEPGPNEKAVKKFADMKGDRFDREYADFMVDDHQKAVKLFRKQADKGDNAELKQFASKTLPALEGHLKMAQDLKAQTKGKKK